MGKTLSFDDINKRLKNNGTLELLDVDGYNSKSKLKVHCVKCDAIYETTRQTILRGCNCAVCSGRKLIVGINDLTTTEPWMLEYFKNKEDGFRYTKASNVRVKTICPNCLMESKIIINNLYKNGFSCKFCGDGISYPNKFIRNLLLNSNVSYVDFEYSPNWIKPLRYDSYFEINNNKYIVEMDGIQHYQEKRFNYFAEDIKEIQSTDKYKQDLAEKHNIEVIRIDCSNTEKIEQKIKESRLKDILDLNSFNFNECKIKSCKSELLLAIEDWNNGLTIIELANKYYVSKATIRDWLRRGNNLSLCMYSPKEAEMRGHKYQYEKYLDKNKTN